MNEPRKINSVKLRNEIECGKSLTILKPILDKLKVVHELYIRGEMKAGKRPVECGFWYHERPNVGLLSAAAWLSGHTTLEEYGSAKGKSKRARYDIWLRIGKRAFQCEAKHQWLGVKRDSEIPKKLRKWLKIACKDAERMEKKNKGTRLALLFSTIAIPVDKSSEFNITNWITELKKEIKEGNLDAFVLIYDPKNSFEVGKFIYKGLLLAIKEKPFV